jgi:hypothetical protein
MGRLRLDVDCDILEQERISLFCSNRVLLTVTPTPHSESSDISTLGCNYLIRK